MPESEPSTSLLSCSGLLSVGFSSETTKVAVSVSSSAASSDASFCDEPQMRVDEKGASHLP